MQKTVPIQLDKSKDEALYIQLAKAFMQLIQQGIFGPDEKLPPIRKLSETLSVNAVTIVNAYKYLEQQGYAYSKIGSGTYVAPAPPIEENSSFSLQEIQMESILQEDSINFASASPSPALFNIKAFQNCINTVLDRDGSFAFEYPENYGYYPLRETLTHYSSTLGISTHPSSIQIISGAQQGIDLIAKSILRYGDTVIVESPTYQGAVESFLSRGAKIIEVSMLSDGIDVTSLELSIQKYRPKLLYCMLQYQNPTGISYSEEKKKKLLELAAKYGFYIVEDDFLSDLSYSKERRKPLKALDIQQNVIYIKSFSKLMMPGLRMGYMIIPQSLKKALLSAKQTTDISSSGLIQRALDLYIREGNLESHLKQLKIDYQERYLAMKKALDEHFPPTITYAPAEGGLNFWIPLPHGFGSNSFYLLCKEQKILLSPGSVFFRHIKDSRFFRLSFGAVSIEQIEEGIKKIKGLLESYLKL